MSDHLVEITLHGKLGKKLGRSTWNLSVASASEGIHAINKMSGGKLFQLLAKEQKKNQKYKILLNDKPLKIDTDVRFDEIHDDKEKSKEQIEAINNSELTINNPKLEKDLQVLNSLRADIIKKAKNKINSYKSQVNTIYYRIDIF